MMRRTLVMLWLLLFAAPAAAAAAPSGVWLFDRAPAYPGVTMIELTRHGRSIGGTMTTAWYGPIAMRNVTLDGAMLGFDIRNLNDDAHPMQHWTARFTKDSVRLAGRLWYADTVQDGRRGTAVDARARMFRLAPPPPLGVALPDDGLARTPPMGWSSWNRFGERIDDATVRAMADAMVTTGLRDAGYRYVNIDDGWQGTRDAAGTLRPNAKFPDMRALADYVHARGLKLGIYSSPGPRTCAGYEGSYGHVQQDAATFAGWGVDYLKYDLCSGEWFYADADGVTRAYRDMGVALRATGRPIVYSLCEYGRFDVASWGRAVGGHLWRTTGDISDDYGTMSDIGSVRNPTFSHTGPGGWNDPDMLEIGNGGMSVDEYRTHLTLWAMQAAPLIMGHDLRRTSDAARALLEASAVIGVDQDALGAQGVRVRADAGLEVWRKPLAGGAIAIALFNRTARPARMRLARGDVGPVAPGTARDVWAGRAINLAAAFLVPAHGVVLIRATTH